MKTLHLISVSALTFGSAVMAAEPPVTGGALQQLAPNKTRPTDMPAVDVRRPDTVPPAPSEADQIKIVVKQLRITGAVAFADDELIRVADFHAGRAYSLLDMRAMAARIAQHYRKRGYVVAQAYLPAQDIKDGMVTVAVAEGHIGQIKVRNQSNVGGGVITGLIDGIASGDVVRYDALESGLLLLSDLPGIRIGSALVPGATFGTSDLLLDILPGKRVDGSVDIDNAGNRYTGAVRIGATINLNEPAGQGDVASLRLLTSGKGLNYFRASYQMVVGKARIGAAYSSLDYALGQEFESLLANGTAHVASFYGSYPLVRSRNKNLYADFSYDNKRFQDRTDSIGAVTDKSANVLSLGVVGDQRNGFGGGGRTSYALHLSAGEISILTPAARLFDAATARSNGHFNKLAFGATHLQQITRSLSLYAGINGQFASKNLDISEKMELGGMYAVRAYPEGEAYGDQATVLNLEAQMQLPNWQTQSSGQLQLVGFIDAGHVKINATPWTTESNHRTLSGIGIGLNWYDIRNFTVRAALAHKLGNAAARSAPDSSYRLWLQAIKYY